jgi:hypothetical protein
MIYASDKPFQMLPLTNQCDLSKRAVGKWRELDKFSYLKSFMRKSRQRKP